MSRCVGHVKITRELARFGLVSGFAVKSLSRPASDAVAAAFKTLSAKPLVAESVLIVTDAHLKSGSSDSTCHCTGEPTDRHPGVLRMARTRQLIGGRVEMRTQTSCISAEAVCWSSEMTLIFSKAMDLLDPSVLWTLLIFIF